MNWLGIALVMLLAIAVTAMAWFIVRFLVRPTKRRAIHGCQHLAFEPKC